MKSIIILVINFMLVATTIAQYDHFTVRVDGLGCPFCAYGLEKKFKEVEDIKDIEVNLQEGILSYRVPASMEMTFEKVLQLVDAAGYTAISVVVKRADGKEESHKSENHAQVYDSVNFMETSIRVLGNCGMCKDRIEKAALKVKGVEKAAWNEEKQELYLEYNSSVTTIEEIHKAVAAVGHDTELVKAPNRVYNRLHDCCKYERE